MTEPTNPKVEISGFEITWDLVRGINLWAGTQAVPTPLNGSDRAGINGMIFTPLSGTVIAGRTSSATGDPNIAVSRGGRVIMNGFLPWDPDTTDNDSDGLPDMIELYQNEIAYVATH